MNWITRYSIGVPCNANLPKRIQLNETLLRVWQTTKNFTPWQVRILDDGSLGWYRAMGLNLSPFYFFVSRISKDFRDSSGLDIRSTVTTGTNGWLGCRGCLCSEVKSIGCRRSPWDSYPFLVWLGLCNVGEKCLIYRVFANWRHKLTRCEFDQTNKLEVNKIDGLSSPRLLNTKVTLFVAEDGIYYLIFTV